jgi:hypothetical protein
MNTTQDRRGSVVCSIPRQSVCIEQVSRHRAIGKINSCFGARSDDEHISEEALKKMVRFPWNIDVEFAAATPQEAALLATACK